MIEAMVAVGVIFTFAIGYLVGTAAAMNTAAAEAKERGEQAARFARKQYEEGFTQGRLHEQALRLRKQ